MAILNIKYDTVTKELSIETDGDLLVKPKDITRIEITRWEDKKGTIDITAYEYSEENKVFKDVRVYASKTEDLVRENSTDIRKALSSILFTK